MTTDALGNEIIIGNQYGYSQQSNGIVTIVVGVVEKVNELKATLKNIKEKSGAYGKIERPFKTEMRARSVNACHLFPICNQS